MRILFLSNLYPPHELGGYGQLCQEVATALSDRGHSIHILTSRHRNKKIRGADGSNAGLSNSPHGQIEITRTLYLQSSIQHYQPLHFLRHFQGEETHNLSALSSLVTAMQPDLIFVWGMWNLSPQLPKLAEELLPGRVAYYICSYWPTDEDIHLAYWNQPTQKHATALIKKGLNLLAQRKFKKIDYPPRLKMENTACVSRFVRNKLVDSGLLPSSAKVIYNGGDFAPFYREFPSQNSANAIAEPVENKTPLRLLYFGRLIADKGVHTAFEALALLHKEGRAEQLSLTVLGNGRDDYMSELRRFADENEINHLIHFVEGVPRDDVPNWLKKHDVFLFTSVWAEPLARSVMEAMMAGLLVIGSEVGGQTEMMINGENALTFQPEDSVGLAMQIKRALADPAAREQMARNGQQLVATRFTQKHMVDEMESWLEEIRQTSANAQQVSKF